MTFRGSLNLKRPYHFHGNLYGWDGPFKHKCLWRSPGKCDERTWKFFIPRCGWSNLIIITISTMWINHLGDIPKDSITRWEIKNNMHIRCPVPADSGLSCSRMFTTLSRFILIGSCKRTELPVARHRGWGSGALCGGGQVPAPYGPGRTYSRRRWNWAKNLKTS
jgi:hypothetical protein